jgi:hypothetical protein
MLQRLQHRLARQRGVKTNHANKLGKKAPDAAVLRDRLVEIGIARQPLRTGDANRPAIRQPLNRPPDRGNFILNRPLLSHRR